MTEVTADELEGLVEGGEAEAAEPAKAEGKTSNLGAGLARGRMAAALVYIVKFVAEGNDSELAQKFATTAGKVSDIRKSRNFKYVTEDLKFTAAEVQDAKDRFKASVNGEKSTVPDESREDIVNTVHAELDKLETVAESQLEGRAKADRKPRGKDKEEAIGETDTPAPDQGTAADNEEAEESLEELLG